MALNVLVVDDEPDIRDLVSGILKDEGFVARTAANSMEAFEKIEDKVPSAIILDIWLQGSDLDGLGILEIVKKRYPLLPVIIISGHGTIETAVTATKMGAFDYIEKPFTYNKLMIVLKRACESAKLKRENYDLKLKVLDKTEIIGSSSVIAKLKSEIEKVAPTAGRVMLLGGAGSGKELAAKLIHQKSRRSSGAFVVFSPTGLPAEQIDRELFGAEESASGVLHKTKRISLIEAANHGTLYIDEVADLPISVQSKLLRFIQDQQLFLAENNKNLKLDIRIITATTRDLQEEINKHKFRQDLYYRLHVVPIKVPSLAERKEDIPALSNYFVKQLARFSGLKERYLAEDTIAALQAYDWPGNIRQLRNIIEWTLIMNPVQGNENQPIKSDMLPTDILNNNLTIVKPNTNFDMMSMSLREAREVFERQYLSAQMSRFNNNISKTSSFVGMERSALHRKLKLLNIHGSNLNKERADEFDHEVENY